MLGLLCMQAILPIKLKWTFSNLAVVGVLVSLVG